MGSENAGTITRISGSLIVAEGMTGAKVGDMVEVGDLRLIGEIIGLYGENVAVQCYEDTTGLRPGEKVIDTGRAIYAELGPGLIGVIFDGLERSEVEMLSLRGSFVGRGLRIPPLSRKKRWHFVPKVKPGERVIEGDIIGTVQEGAIEHRIMVPVGLGGTITDISEGEFRVTDPVASLESRGGEEIELTMMQTWPVRVPRPYKEKVTLTEPLVTGQRVIDSFFPVAKGGTAAIPGGFGTGKTVLLQQIAKWADSDIIIYVGCGERGNEMADLITHFPELIDPKTGKRLMERTVIIANVSNMPVSAREASVYMGVTIAEYFRDQGYDVALMADSTSRWAEAMRDISGRLGEMPVERGYPAYLSDRTAGFYERAGRVVTLGRDRRKGSITILGAVSPPGGDFSEPVTQLTLRYIETFWALDFDLAARRHFPAINWLRSYSRHLGIVTSWWEKLDPEWGELRRKAIGLLETAARIEEMASIIGEKALPDSQRLLLLVAEIIREGFLIQNAYHDVDTYCSPQKQVRLLRLMLGLYDLVAPLIEQEVPLEKIRELPIVSKITRVKEAEIRDIEELEEEIRREVERLSELHGVRSLGV